MHCNCEQRRARLVRFSLAGLWLGLAIPFAASAQDWRGQLPPGTTLAKVDTARLAAASFGKQQPVVGTYYFYWYDDQTKEHFLDGDGSDALTDHPADARDYRYRSPDWHRRELLEMQAAGLDFALPVFWGYPGDYQSWSFEGLKALVEACRRLRAEGQRVPRIGLFYDTSTLQHNRHGYHADLATERGRQWLYVTVRDFYLHVPAEFWASIDGRPLVWLYNAGFARRQDPAALDYVRQEFRRDFGVEPFIVKETSWQGRADAAYAWGAALRPNVHSVAAVGPGYDHSAVPGRTPLVRRRENGAFYRQSWELVLSRDPATRPPLAIVETWNEWHEGTDIAPSREYGRQYLELTRHYADLWHAGKRVPRSGKFAAAQRVSLTFTDPPESRGLSLFTCEDGQSQAISLAGQRARQTQATRFTGRYLYFDVDDSFFAPGDGALQIEVRYFDAAPGTLLLEYDASDAAAPHGGAFKALPLAEQRGARAWQTATARIADAAFTGRANGGDFRLSVAGADTIVAQCTLHKVAASAPPPRP